MDKETLSNLLKDCGVNLYDTETLTEHDKKIYRIYITADEPITLEKCTKVTKIISPIIDLDPPVRGEYFLEVSSPGIDRKLTSLEHFAFSKGDLVKLKLNDGRKFKAKILGVDGNNILLYDKEKKEDITLPFGDINKAKTYFEW